MRGRIQTVIDHHNLTKEDLRAATGRLALRSLPTRKNPRRGTQLLRGLGGYCRVLIQGYPKNGD
jgi:hypothetical protein